MSKKLLQLARDSGLYGSANESVHKYLKSLGYPQQINEATYKYLGFLGYEGALPERVRKFEDGDVVQYVLQTLAPALDSGTVGDPYSDLITAGTYTAQNGATITSVSYTANGLPILLGDAAVNGAVLRAVVTTDLGGPKSFPAFGTVVLAAIAPTVSTPATITPASGPIGTVFTLDWATFNGTTPITVTGTLTQDGVDVTGDIVGLQFTSTALGDLVWTVTGTNDGGSDQDTAIATIAEVVSSAQILSITGGVEQITIEYEGTLTLTGGTETLTLEVA